MNRIAQKQTIGAIDQGTTSTRFVIFDAAGDIIAMHQLEHRQIYPRPDWVEHDPLEIKDNTAMIEIDQDVKIKVDRGSIVRGAEDLADQQKK